MHTKISSLKKTYTQNDTRDTLSLHILITLVLYTLNKILGGFHLTEIFVFVRRPDWSTCPGLMRNTVRLSSRWLTVINAARL